MVAILLYEEALTSRYGKHQTRERGRKGEGGRPREGGEEGGYQ